jgi:hypothetical protein
MKKLSNISAFAFFLSFIILCVGIAFKYEAMTIISGLSILFFLGLNVIVNNYKPIN